MNRPLIIVGASTRAAAQSALRAGFTPWLADMFADADLEACGPVRRVDPYPDALLDIFANAPDTPWIYTGALENYPDLVAQLASLRPLWGNSAATLRRVRDPFQLAATLQQAGFQTPQVRKSLDATPVADGWVRKLMHSAGGRNITLSEPASRSANGVYFQQRIAGQPVAAVYVADAANTKNTKLLGITTQFIGNDGSGHFWCTGDWTGAKNFWYAGSIGPITQPPWLQQRATEIGQHIANEFGLVGLFGIDAILTADGLWPLEVNPRYTASIEIIERATGIAAIEWHARAAGTMGSGEWGMGNVVSANKHVYGKVVLYATHDFHVPQSFTAWAADLNARSTWPTVADIPYDGSHIPTGYPICTVFAEAADVSKCIESLKQTVEAKK